jgi:aconitase A
MVDGKEVRLKDLWPSDAEIDAIVKLRHVKPANIFAAVYDPMFDRCWRATRPEKVNPLYDVAPAKHLHPASALLGRRTGG